MGSDGHDPIDPTRVAGLALTGHMQVTLLMVLVQRCCDQSAKQPDAAKLLSR